MRLWQPPPTLILVLKRFRVHESNGLRYKLNNRVNFPVDGAGGRSLLTCSNAVIMA